MLLTLLYLVGLLRTVIFLAVIYLIIRWFTRLFMQGYRSSDKQNPRQSPTSGETTIRFNEKGKKIVDKNQGEYVDFEEVE